MNPISFLISLPIRAYRAIFSPWVGHNCRYQPTCSAYALEALKKRGAIVGVYLIVKRLLKCHPWGGQGYDGVHVFEPEEVLFHNAKFRVWRRRVCLLFLLIQSHPGN